MKAGSHFEQAGNAAAYDDAPAGRLRDPAQDLEKRRFSGSVAPDDTDKLALLDFEVNIAQRPELLGDTTSPSTEGSKPLHRLSHGAIESVPQAISLSRLVSDEIAL